MTNNYAIKITTVLCLVLVLIGFLQCKKADKEYKNQIVNHWYLCDIENKSENIGSYSIHFTDKKNFTEYYTSDNGANVVNGTYDINGSVLQLSTRDYDYQITKLDNMELNLKCKYGIYKYKRK